MDFFTDKMKAWAVPVIVAVISLFGKRILDSIDETKMELRMNREAQIRWEEQLTGIKFQLQNQKETQDHMMAELDAVKTHIYRWE